MAEAPSWRKIETVLVEFFKADHWLVDENIESGDKVVDDELGSFINLTSLAKHQEDRL